MNVKYSISIKPFTSFGVEAKTATLIDIYSLDDLQNCRNQGLLSTSELLVMGGGSNMLFCSDFNGVILRPVMKGITVISQTDTAVIIEAKAGEVWDDLVAFTVEKGYYGLENLSFIPGKVGASPVQNIGAYGIEVQSVINRVEAFEIETGEIHYFNNEDCRFGYRDSIFKLELKSKFIITAVQYKLSLIPHCNIAYKDVQLYLKDEKEVTLQKVRDAIIAIRIAKLPDPAVVGNAGSFFKNPVISAQQAAELKSLFPSIIMYPLEDGSQKVSAGWLIDQAGWKGFRRGDAGVHPNQALCLINYGTATGNEILELAIDIQNSVFEKFQIHISPEVRIV